MDTLSRMDAALDGVGYGDSVRRVLAESSRHEISFSEGAFPSVRSVIVNDLLLHSILNQVLQAGSCEKEALVGVSKSSAVVRLSPRNLASCC